MGFAAERALVGVYAILLLLSSALLLRHYTRSRWALAALLAFLVPFGVAWWPLPSHHWVVDLTQLLALVALARGLEAERPAGWGLLGGGLTALGCFSMQNQGAYLLLALLVVFFPWIRARRVRSRLLLGWIAGGLLVAGAFALYLLPHVSLPDLLYQWVSFPATQYTLLPGNVGAFANLGWGQLATEAWTSHLVRFPDYTIPQTALALGLPLVPLAATATLVAAWVGRWHGREMVALLAAGALAFYGSSLNRFSQTNLVWAAPMGMVVVAWGLARLAEGPIRWRRRLGQALGAVVVLGCASYAVGHLRLGSARGTTRVSGPAGTLVVPAASTQSSMQIVLDAVEANVPAGAPLFCTRYNDPLDRHVLTHYTPVWSGPWALLMAPPRR